MMYTFDGANFFVNPKDGFVINSLISCDFPLPDDALKRSLKLLSPPNISAFDGVNLLCSYSCSTSIFKLRYLLVDLIILNYSPKPELNYFKLFVFI